MAAEVGVPLGQAVSACFVRMRQHVTAFKGHNSMPCLEERSFTSD